MGDLIHIIGLGKAVESGRHWGPWRRNIGDGIGIR